MPKDTAPPPVPAGSLLLVVGFPLGFHDALGLNCAWYADILLTLTGQ
jgi:hypothetical protein